MRGTAPRPVLTRLFLRRFLENDLISPEADRSLLLAMLGAGVVSSTLFVTTFLSSHYVTASMTPGEVAVTALNDRFFYLALSMVVTALVAAAQWDALVVDARDTAILEALPLRPATIRRAKLAAVAILGGAVALAVNAAPSLVFPWLVGFSQHISAAWMPVLAAAHAAFTVAGALFAYATIIAFRELLAAALGPRWFARVSPWTQAALVVALGSALLLLPAAAGRIEQRGFEGWRAMSPPMWFLGAYEAAVGGILLDQPREGLTPQRAVADARSSAIYRSRQPQLRSFARRAAAAVGLIALILLATYLGNARRLPSFPLPAGARARRRWEAGRKIGVELIAPAPTIRAGFFFALAVMGRSSTHRLTLACAGAAGLAVAVVALSGVDLQEASSGGRPPSRLLVVQPILFGALLLGFRHVIRVPAELRANWAFQLAWRERGRAFLAGVKRAALVALVAPALAACFPLVAFVLGPWAALAHAALGLAGAVVLLEMLTATYDKVPFTCTYVPYGGAKLFVPISLVLFLAGASSFARLQAAALESWPGAVRLLLVLAAMFAMARAASLRQPRRALVAFDEAPATFQRLGLDA